MIIIPILHSVVRPEMEAFPSPGVRPPVSRLNPTPFIRTVLGGYAGTLTNIFSGRAKTRSFPRFYSRSLQPYGGALTKALAGKVVLVTGAARGMGKLDAIVFARERGEVHRRHPGVRRDGHGQRRGAAFYLQVDRSPQGIGCRGRRREKEPGGDLSARFSGEAICFPAGARLSRAVGFHLAHGRGARGLRYLE